MTEKEKKYKIHVLQPYLETYRNVLKVFLKYPEIFHTEIKYYENRIHKIRQQIKNF